MAQRDTHRGTGLRLLRAEDIQRILKIGRSKAYRLMNSGEIPVVDLGYQKRVVERDLWNWIDERREVMVEQ